MVRDKGKGKTGASSTQKIVEEFTNSGSREYVAANPSQRPAKRLRRTEGQVKADKQKGWKEGIMKHNFKNERQVKAKSIGSDRLVIQHIKSKGMNFWTRRLEGYNANCVFEFYRNMKTPPAGFETSTTARITLKVGNKDIMINPNMIVEYLGYERPPPETVNYPRSEQIDSGLIDNVLYLDRKMAMIPHVSGAFRDDIWVLDKAFHHNLYPRGLEHNPS